MNWWEKDPQRLETEKALMNNKFPQFVLGEAEKDWVIHGLSIVRNGEKYWLGKLRTISGNIYTVVLAYPTYYPGGEVKCFVVNPTINHTKHRHYDGRLCLYSNDHGGRGSGKGIGMTVVSYAGWVASWLHAHEIYEIKRVWPENDFFSNR